MVDRIEGGGSFHSDRERLDKYNYAADKFQQALNKYNELDDPKQKKVCVHVMTEYALTMNHLAVDLRRERLLRQTEEIRKDLAADNPSPDKLQADLNRVKKSTS
jgi:hypothetical protein